MKTYTAVITAFNDPSVGIWGSEWRVTGLSFVDKADREFQIETLRAAFQQIAEETVDVMLMEDTP